jgi:hypothetical protein
VVSGAEAAWPAIASVATVATIETRRKTNPMDRRAAGSGKRMLMLSPRQKRIPPAANLPDQG